MVEFGAAVDPEINDQVLALDQSLLSSAIPGVLETVPTYRSLMIHYDPLVLDRETLIANIRALPAGTAPTTKPRSLWTIPCCYRPPCGEDSREVAETLGLSESEVIHLHSQTTFRVYMYGFAPGFCYLGGLPKELSVSRRSTPRSPHASNAILMAGGLSLIGTFPMPTGWWVIGRTPVRMFSATRTPNFLVEVGDLVRFSPVDEKKFEALEKRAASGDQIASCEPVR